MKETFMLRQEDLVGPSHTASLPEFGKLEYSTAFILVNVMTMITILPGNLLPLQMMKGYAKSSDGVRSFCIQHIWNWGMCCGVQNADQFDASQVVVILILKLAGWAPYRLIQLYVALACIYWVLNMQAINLSTIAGGTRFAKNPVPPAIAGYFTFMGQFELATVLWRAVEFVPQGSTGLLIGWFCICVVWFIRVSVRIATVQTNPLWLYMMEVMYMRDAYVNDGGHKWNVGDDDPEGFDLVKETETPLEHMKEQYKFQGLPLPGDMTNAAGINEAINDYISSQTCSMMIWMPCYLLILVILAALPAFVCKA